MKKTPSPYLHYPSQRNHNSHHPHHESTGSYPNKQQRHHHKTHPALNFLRTAAKKVAGIFTIVLPQQRKAVKPNRALSNATNNNDNSQVSTEISSGSSGWNSPKLKSPLSYRSSRATSGLDGSGTFSFNFEEICKVTDNFAPANKIGEGSFGTVYRGRLRDGSVVAVKRARKHSFDKRLALEYKNEILTLSNIEHLNLVKLYGFLEHGDERLTVVEYVANGNLREHLDGTQGSGLEIAERLDIAIDVAHAITYLHMYTDHPIIHRDIKASNILITEKLRAKVADFGFARFVGDDPGASHISTQIKGTSGYLDPEYLRTSQLTEKSDVYSFGVLLVELMTGRHPIDHKRPQNERITIKWAIRRLREGDVVIAMDPRLRRSPASNVAVEKVLKLAHQCLANMRQSRPSMRKCSEVLWSIRKDLREKTMSSSTSRRSANFADRDAKQSRQTLFGIKDDKTYKFISA